MEDLTEPRRLTVELAPHVPGPVVRVAGELDHDTAPELLRAVRQALADSTGAVVIDCSAVAFCDSSGLNAFLRARRDAVGAQRRLVLAAPSRATLRVLRLTGADAVFPLAPTVEGAFTAPG